VTQPVVRILACAGLVAAGLLIGGGIASADSGHRGLGIGHEKNDNNKPRNDLGPISPPMVRIGAREDRGGHEVGPARIRISRQPGFRGGIDISPGGPGLTIDERGIRGAVNLGPGGSRLAFGRGWSGGSGVGRERGARAEAALSPSGTGVESEQRVAGQGSTGEVGASEGRGTAPGIGGAAIAQRLSIYVPLPRPVAATGARTQSPFTTVVISVPTGSKVRVNGQPQPEPTPSPGLRTSAVPTEKPNVQVPTEKPNVEVPTEKPNVEAIDSSGQGGSDHEPTGGLQPVRAPVVIAPPPVASPRPVTPPNAPPVIPPVAVTPPVPVGGRAGSRVQAPNSIVAGAPPRMREPAPTPAPAPPTGAVPVDIRATRVGYQQYLRTAKTSDIAIVALPGLTGLVLMTVSGAVIGHRQARAGHMLRHSGAARFMA
jgi:hypothetical protein